jgi:hypothetical protein
LFRKAVAVGSTTGGLPAAPKNNWPEAAAVPPIVPIVAEAASLAVVMVSVPFCANVAWRLFVASIALRSFSVLT